ncbi:hypothetical protein CEXT_18441 [Caerostris extrusa]|uniref:Uncharacterized protein n=1 Tax=Caerostris extrusa TaxID=172846 RepID=A0AAV4UDG2_CAEEX|nr:hypothetical protein CEXT_18441 [Caerostris extrusa]
MKKCKDGTSKLDETLTEHNTLDEKEIPFLCDVEHNTLDKKETTFLCDVEHNTLDKKETTFQCDVGQNTLENTETTFLCDVCNTLEKSERDKELNNSELSSDAAYVGQSIIYHQSIIACDSCPGIGQFRQLKRIPIVISNTAWMICQSLSIEANLDENKTNENFNEIKN